MSDPTIILGALIGLFVGSLVNVVVVRLPREQQFGGWPRCTRCGHALAWWQVLPLILVFYPYPTVFCGWEAGLPSSVLVLLQ